MGFGFLNSVHDSGLRIQFRVRVSEILRHARLKLQLQMGTIEQAFHQFFQELDMPVAISTQTHIELRFFDNESPRLERVVFENQKGERRVSIRGTYPWQGSNADSAFQLTNAVQAMAILMVRHAASVGSKDSGIIEGQQGTPALSLIHSLEKKTTWIAGMFGSTEDRKSTNLHRMLRRCVVSPKAASGRSSKVIVKDILPKENTQIFLNDVRVTAPQELLRLAKCLEERWKSTTNGDLSVPRTGTTGVFGVCVRRGEDGKNRVLLNVRTDQGKQRANAMLPADSTVEIVDLPGGTWRARDESIQETLYREVIEETGCEVRILSEMQGPFTKAALNSAICDYAWVCEIEVKGDPKRSSEASRHVWLTWDELTEQTRYRLPSTLGYKGRMGQMIDRILHGAIQDFERIEEMPNSAFPDDYEPGSSSKERRAGK